MLTTEDVLVLSLERDLGMRRQDREEVAHRLLGVLPHRYHQLVLEAASKPEALAVDPVTVNRIRRRMRPHRIV
jgi:hypothetical protein